MCQLSEAPASAFLAFCVFFFLDGLLCCPGWPVAHYVSEDNPLATSQCYNAGLGVALLLVSYIFIIIIVFTACLLVDSWVITILLVYSPNTFLLMSLEAHAQESL